MSRSRAYRATRYSLLALRPAKPIRPSGVTVWEHWDTWAERNGILGKNGKPSLSKVKMLVKHKVLAATLSKCGQTFSGRFAYYPGDDISDPVFRRMTRIVVAPRCPDQLDWEPWRWQAEYQALFSRAQGNKAKGRRRR